MFRLAKARLNHRKKQRNMLVRSVAAPNATFQSTQIMVGRGCLGEYDDLFSSSDLVALLPIYAGIASNVLPSLANPLAASGTIVYEDKKDS